MMERDRELHEMADEGRALMSDYIKREDAKDAVINVVGRESIARYLDEMSKHFSTKDNDYYDALMDAEDAIDDLPSADVAPVSHGHWIKISPAGIYECSECGKNVMTSDIEAYEYCHGCGARMDEEVD